MRVLMAITYYYPHWTGLTAYAQRLAEALVARGHHVTVVSAQFRRDLPLEEVHEGVRVIRAPSWLQVSRGPVMPSYLGIVRRLVKEHDVVQVHTPMLETWMVGVLAHHAHRPMLITHHGDLVLPSGLKNQIVQQTVGFLLDRGAREADLITTHCGDYADHSSYLAPVRDKVVAIYPPVEIPRPDMQQAAAWRRALGLEGCCVIGFAGRFVEEKGFDYLLRAIPAILDRRPNARFVYAGAVPRYERFLQRWQPLVDAHREHILMLGLITDPQKLAQFYAMCDVFALPSRSDCFPSVQIEAMLCGTPVVAANIPGAREVVQVTGMGLLVEPHRPTALAEGLLAVLGDREGFVRPYSAIRERFDTRRSVMAYEQALEQLVGAPKEVRFARGEPPGNRRLRSSGP